MEIMVHHRSKERRQSHDTNCNKKHTLINKKPKLSSAAISFSVNFNVFLQCNHSKYDKRFVSAIMGKEVGDI